MQINKVKRALDEGKTVQLDGTGSSDPDQASSTLTYQWDFDGDAVYGEASTARVICSADAGDLSDVSEAAASLVLEVPLAGEDHRDAVFVGHGDHLIVLLRSARLDNARHAGLGGVFDVVGEREECIRGHSAAFRFFAGSLERYQA